MTCIWSSSCHCHPVISCFSKIQNGLSLWYRPTEVVLEKRPINNNLYCVCVLINFSSTCGRKQVLYFFSITVTVYNILTRKHTQLSFNLISFWSFSAMSQILQKRSFRDKGAGCRSLCPINSNKTLNGTQRTDSDHEKSTISFLSTK